MRDGHIDGGFRLIAERTDTAGLQKEPFHIRDFDCARHDSPDTYQGSSLLIYGIVDFLRRSHDLFKRSEIYALIECLRHGVVDALTTQIERMGRLCAPVTGGTL